MNYKRINYDTIPPHKRWSPNDEENDKAIQRCPVCGCPLTKSEQPHGICRVCKQEGLAA